MPAASSGCCTLSPDVSALLCEGRDREFALSSARPSAFELDQIGECASVLRCLQPLAGAALSAQMLAPCSAKAEIVSLRFPVLGPVPSSLIRSENVRRFLDACSL